MKKSCNKKQKQNIENKQKFYIAIDGNEANIQKRVGSNVYAFFVLKQMYELVKKHKNVYIDVLLKDKPLDDLPAQTKNFKYKVIKPGLFWSQFALPIFLFLNKNKYCAFYTPSHYAPFYCPVKYINTIHDLAFFKFKNYFLKKDYLKLKNWTEFSVLNASKIASVSLFTKKEILKYYKTVDSKKIFIASSCLNIKQKENKEEKQKRILDKYHVLSKKYFIYVGTLQKRKNLDRLIKAFLKFIKNKKYKDYKLLIVGKKGWLYEDLKKYENKQTVIFTGFVSDEVKQVLIQNAKALFLVSLYEGQGMPVLEAMRLKTLPIVSKDSPMQDLVKDKELLVDPYDIDSIYQGFKRVVLFTKKQINIKLNKLYKISKQFTWEKTSKVIFDNLIDLCKK